MTPGTAFFDMNETTLDLDPVRQVVDRHLASAGGFTVWFQRLLQLSMATTTTGLGFIEFGALARDAFDAVAANADHTPPDDAFGEVATAIAGIGPFQEVPAAMERLKDAGWQLIALTNSGQAMVDGQVERAGLSSVFDHVLSVESVQTYKPSPAPYERAMEVAGCSPEEAWMVASHDWDLAGARAVGMNTAFIQRPHMTYAPTWPDPELSVANFTALADALTT